MDGIVNEQRPEDDHIPVTDIVERSLLPPILPPSNPLLFYRDETCDSNPIGSQERRGISVIVVSEGAGLRYRR